MTTLEVLVREALGLRAPGALPAATGLAAYLDLVLEANEGINLVSRKEAVPRTLVGRHLVDALEALPLLPPGGTRPLRLLDVGSGGGFPALPLLIVRRDVQGVLVESVGKKARFLEQAIRVLGLTARVVNARFPDPALDEMRKFPPCDLVTSRAVAGAGGIVRQAVPALRRGASAILWTSEPLLDDLRRALPGAKVSFQKSPDADRRGIARVECFT